MKWTAEKKELLRKLWIEGIPTSAIARQIDGATRNAVIGKAHSLKLPSRGRSNSTTSRQRKSKVVSNPGVEKSTNNIVHLDTSSGKDRLPMTIPPEPRESVVVPISRKLALVQLNEDTCKWPNGDFMTKNFSFCGNGVAEKKPYCEYHSKIAYQPISERRRTR